MITPDWRGNLFPCYCVGVSGTEHEILISIDEAFASVVARDELESLASRVLASEAVGVAELGIVVTDDETVRRLNREYAGDDYATDVLSFSLQEGEDFASPDGMTRLGEVIVSYSTAKRQAGEAGHSVDEEVAHLLVHGILHLLGYDHAEAADKKRMRLREETLLGHKHGHEPI
jgi:probable rRNA maturation factor